MINEIVGLGLKHVSRSIKNICRIVAVVSIMGQILGSHDKLAYLMRQAKILAKTTTTTVHIQQAKAGEGIERSPHDIRVVDEHENCVWMTGYNDFRRRRLKSDSIWTKILRIERKREPSEE